jgi:hypothetical protein
MDAPCPNSCKKDILALELKYKKIIHELIDYNKKLKSILISKNIVTVYDNLPIPTQYGGAKKKSIRKSSKTKVSKKKTSKK